MDVVWAAEAVKDAQEVVQVSGIDSTTLIKVAAILGAGFCMGVGAIGAALGEGYIGGKAMEGIARQPELQGVLTRTMIIADAIAETTGVYSLFIAILLLFVI
ncbi:MAG: ATP synthase F0 subunit C [Candidatus Omnitrophica bacterium]|nr:ATP synthase F0 subunit C [Candidatus Omnitrophota bacterium]